MNRYLVPALLTAVLIAVLVGVNRGLHVVAGFMSTDMLLGFLLGCIFCVALYGLIYWIDPASRPRGSGSAADQERARNRFD